MSCGDLPKVCIHLVAGECDNCLECQEEHRKKRESQDRRLRNWKRWMQMRKETHQVLGKGLNRQPGDLLMNAAEDERQAVTEQKIVLDYTNILEPDSQRGCPGFWELPVALAEVCVPPTYFAVKTKQDNCIIPDIEYVKVPDVIKTEKDCVLTRNIYAGWEKLTYKHEKLKELKYEVDHIQPHKPQLDDLVIVGKSLHDQVIPDEESLIEEMALEEESLEIEEPPSDPLFIINGLKIFAESSGTMEIRMNYDYDVDSQQLSTSYLRLENIGSRAVHYFWKKCKKFNLFSEIIKENFEETKFFFNRNENIIIPGKVLDIPIWFKTYRTGRFSENWMFCTVPPLGNNLTLILELVAVSSVPDYDEKLHKIDENIDLAMRNAIISETLDTAIKQATIKPKKATIYTYNKGKIFEAINSYFDPIQKTPQYLYNRDVVNALDKFYQKVKQPYQSLMWNLNLEDLRTITKEKEAMDAEEEEEKEFSKFVEITKERRALKQKAIDEKMDRKTTCEENKLLREAAGKKGKGKDKKAPKKETPEKKGKGKGKAAVEPIPEPPEEVPAEPTLSEELEMLIGKLERSTSIMNKEQTKYLYAHSIFVAHFNHLCEKLEDLKDRLHITPPCVYPRLEESPIVAESPRLTCETFKDALPHPKEFEISLNIKDRPPPDILKDIPIEDCNRRYRAYFNIPEVVPEPPGKKGKKDKKGKGDKKEKKEKGKKGDKKSGKEKEAPKVEEDDKYVINEDFHPYKDIQFEKEEIGEEEVEDIKDIYMPLSTFLNYRYNLYVLFYTYIEMAIMRITEMIDVTNHVDLPHPHIKKIECVNKFWEMKDEDVGIKYINLNVINSEVWKEEDLSKLKNEFIGALKKTLENRAMLKDFPDDSLEKSASKASLWSVFQTYHPPAESSRPISYPEKISVLKKQASAMATTSKSDVFTETSDAEAQENWSRHAHVNIQTDELEKYASDEAKAEEHEEEMLEEMHEDMQLKETTHVETVKGRSKVAISTKTTIFSVDTEKNKMNIIEQTMRCLSVKDNRSTVDTRLISVRNAVKAISIASMLSVRDTKMQLIEKTMTDVSKSLMSMPDSRSKFCSKMITIERAMGICHAVKAEKLNERTFKKAMKLQNKDEKELGYLIDYVSDEEYFYDSSDDD